MKIRAFSFAIGWLLGIARALWQDEPVSNTHQDVSVAIKVVVSILVLIFAGRGIYNAYCTDKLWEDARRRDSAKQDKLNQ